MLHPSDLAPPSPRVDAALEPMDDEQFDAFERRVLWTLDLILLALIGTMLVVLPYAGYLYWTRP